MRTSVKLQQNTTSEKIKYTRGWRSFFHQNLHFRQLLPTSRRSESIIFISTCHSVTVYGKVHFPPRETRLLFGNFSPGPSPLFAPPVALFRTRRFITRRGTFYPFFSANREKRSKRTWGSGKTRSRLQIGMEKEKGFKREGKRKRMYVLKSFSKSMLAKTCKRDRSESKIPRSEVFVADYYFKRSKEISSQLIKISGMYFLLLILN